MPKRTLSEAEIEECIRFADSALAAAGHFVDRPESTEDIRQRCVAITSDEVIQRAAARATGQS